MGRGKGGGGRVGIWGRVSYSTKRTRRKHDVVSGTDAADPSAELPSNTATVQHDPVCTEVQSRHRK